MMARGHSSSGLAIASLLLVTSAFTQSPINIVLIPLLIAGASLIPDIDQVNSTISHSLGFITYFISKITDTFCVIVYTHTKTRHDSERVGGHRTLTHTILFGVILGLLTYFIILNIPYSSEIIIWYMSCLSVKAIFKLYKSQRILAYMLCLIIPAFQIIGTIQPISPIYIALSIAIGCITHCLGDCLTDSGCPLFFPVPLGNKMWRRFSLNLFSTGTDSGRKVENNFILLFIVVYIVLLGYTVYGIL